MDRDEWAQRAAESRIQQQLAVADGLDGKSGILFAYSGAVIAAAGTIPHQGTEGVMLLALGFAAIAFTTAAFVMWPQKFYDSPDAEKLADVLSKDRPKEQIVKALLNRQLDDGAVNEVILKIKARSLRVTILGAAAATVLLLIGIAQGRWI